MRRELDPVRLLADYIRIDTSNPPGDETKAAGYLGRSLADEKIGCKIYEATPGRISLRASVPGSGQKKPLILLNHMDVVPADKSQWSFDPFGGEIIDGHVCGRGALDMKGIAVMQLMALVDLKRRGVTPNRDVVFLAVADEEEGGGLGARWLLENHAADFETSLVLNEGGFGIEGMLPDQPLMMISAAEKGLCWLKLNCRGKGGHGSMPGPENPAAELTAALSRLLVSPAPAWITPIAADYFLALAQALEFLAPYKQNPSPEILLALLEQSGLMALPQVGAMVRNTLSLTVLDAGHKTNVIPDQATAHLDGRLLPGQNGGEFIEEIIGALDEPKIEIKRITVDEASQSTWQGDDYQVIAEVLGQAFPEAVIAPSLMPGTSDSRFFRYRGINAYGVCPAVIPMADLATVHGVDEKISEQNLINGAAVYTKLVGTLSGT